MRRMALALLLLAACSHSPTRPKLDSPLGSWSGSVADEDGVVFTFEVAGNNSVVGSGSMPTQSYHLVSTISATFEFAGSVEADSLRCSGTVTILVTTDAVTDTITGTVDLEGRIDLVTARAAGIIDFTTSISGPPGTWSAIHD